MFDVRYVYYLYSYFKHALIHFGMPASNRPAADIINSDVQFEQQFDMTSLATFVAYNERLLTAEQRNVYDQINV